MKKTISILLAVLMLAGCLSAAFSVSAVGDTDGNITWDYNTSTKKLTISGNGVMNDYEDYGQPWYAYHEEIKTVVINSGVTSIGNRAFGRCKAISSISIPNTVKSIGEDAFFACHALESIEIPESVTSIGRYAFLLCDSLKSVNLPSKLKVVAYGLFDSCHLLESVTIPDGVTEIEGFAFEDCDSLSSITIPASVTRMGPKVFTGCIEPFTINYAGDKALWSKINIDEDEDEGTFSTGGEVVRPLDYTVNFLNTVYFNLSEITGQIENITWTFNAFTQTLTVTGEGTIPYVDNEYPEAWNVYRDRIKMIVIGSGITAIDDFVFYEFKSLEIVTIPKSVTSIGAVAFALNRSLKTVNYEGSEAEWNNIEVGQYAFCDANEETGDVFPLTFTKVFNYVAPQAENYTYVRIKDKELDTINAGDWYYDWRGYVKSINEYWDSLTPEQQESQISSYRDSILSFWYCPQTGVFCVLFSDGDITTFGPGAEFYDLQRAYLIHEGGDVDSGQPGNPDQPGQPDNPGDNNQPQGGEDQQPAKTGSCKYCGEDHTGFFGFFVKIFHSILALFGLRK